MNHLNSHSQTSLHSTAVANALPSRPISTNNLNSRRASLRFEANRQHSRLSTPDSPDTKSAKLCPTLQLLPPLHLSVAAVERINRSCMTSVLYVPGSTPDPIPPSLAQMPIPRFKNIKSNAWASRMKERQYEINLVTRQMEVYEPLLDPYLSDYFQNTNTRKHLRNLGLIRPNGEIIDHLEFKYAQIKKDREKKEAQLQKEREDRELDREIEVAIRTKIRKENSMRHQQYQSMGRQGHQKPYPEFLADYPVSMWGTVLLYAQKPPSLTHVGGVRRRGTKSAPQKPRPEKRPDSETHGIQKLFSNAKERFDLGDFAAVKNILRELVSSLSQPDAGGSQEELEHYATSQAIQEAIEKAGISLTSSERLLLGYVVKLGGNVENYGDSAGAVESLPALKPDRPQSARPATRDSDFPPISETTSNLTTSSSTPHLVRPNSARKTRISDFKEASEFSLGDRSENNSVHFVRPPSARPNRLAEYPNVNKFSNDSDDEDVIECRDGDKVMFSEELLKSGSAGFISAAKSDSCRMGSDYKYDEDVANTSALHEAQTHIIGLDGKHENAEGADNETSVHDFDPSESVSKTLESLPKDSGSVLEGNSSDDTKDSRDRAHENGSERGSVSNLLEGQSSKSASIKTSTTRMDTASPHIAAKTDSNLAITQNSDCSDHDHLDQRKNLNYEEELEIAENIEATDFDGEPEPADQNSIEPYSNQTNDRKVNHDGDGDGENTELASDSVTCQENEGPDHRPDSQEVKESIQPGSSFLTNQDLDTILRQSNDSFMIAENAVGVRLGSRSDIRTESTGAKPLESKIIDEKRELQEIEHKANSKTNSNESVASHRKLPVKSALKKSRDPLNDSTKSTETLPTGSHYVLNSTGSLQVRSKGPSRSSLSRRVAEGVESPLDSRQTINEPDRHNVHFEQQEKFNMGGHIQVRQ
ncbi:hypothetical protein CcCBS67573_g03810 [Chytriomyces confervae]|uniref:Uncharacterized protein n=1 Tax=Chytriomyces confervae TaxID=246404 RepID=A0A507FGX6_9FUNG|nr:hypothetical protein CcCBS67573_g03810 [Chytriomyces confervae]